MKRRNFYIICTTIIIIANMLMIIINHGEETISNLFIIVLVLFFFPHFLWAADVGLASQIKLEATLLLILVILSLVRLMNRIAPLPDAVSYLIAIVAFILITVLLVAGIIRWIDKNKKD
ncbi:hypothetical protein [Streptococcus dentiloxodontae]